MAPRRSRSRLLAQFISGLCIASSGTALSGEVTLEAQLLTPSPAVQPTPQSEAAKRAIFATPPDYLAKIRKLKAGQTLVLTAGIYDDPNDVPGLPIFGLNGTASAPITITGAGDPTATVLKGRAGHNTVRFANSSYVVVKNLTIDGGNLGGDGVNAQGVSHHVTLENLVVKGVGGNQQVVAISTNGATTWNWVIRGNTIIGAGTGMYLGNSDGSNPFIAGLIEHNVVRDTIGYNIQIKHQVAWPDIPGLPAGRTTTAVRHNVLVKGSNSSTGSLARPNLLIGDVPSNGPGSENTYEIYGNLLYQNPTEALFQAEGNISFYANLLVNRTGSAATIQRHNGSVRTVNIFGNTVVAAKSGISVRDGHPSHRQRVFANAVFAGTPVSGADATDNVVDTYANAVRHLNNPSAELGDLDLYPKAGSLRGEAIDVSRIGGLTDWDLDFNGHMRIWAIRGAYSGGGTNPGWLPRLEPKPQ